MASIRHVADGKLVPFWPADTAELAALGPCHELTSTFDTVRFPASSELPISLSFEDGMNVVHDIAVEKLPCSELKVLVPMPESKTKHFFNEHKFLVWEGLDLKERTLVDPQSTFAVCTFSYTGTVASTCDTTCAPDGVLAPIAPTHGIRIHVQTFCGNGAFDESAKAFWEDVCASGHANPGKRDCIETPKHRSESPTLGIFNARVHLALLLTQFCWGSAAVVNKLGLSGLGMNPLLFALVREVTAAPLLFLIIAFIRGNLCPWSGWSPASPLVDDPDDAPHTDYRWSRSVSDDSLFASKSMVFMQSGAARLGRVVLRFLPGVFIFLDQFCSLIGVKLANATSASAWQPSQIIFTISISVCIGAESLTWRKSLGVLLTVMGAACLFLLQSPSTSDQGDRPLLGQCLFCVNCLASSMEVILWRRLLRSSRSPLGHLAVMAESYLMAAVLMVAACVSVSHSPFILNLICAECQGNAWHLPAGALWAIAYSVIFQTIIGYCAQAWALRYAESSLVALYATMQPVTATAISCTLLSLGWSPQGVLTWPGREMSGAVLIILGLMVTVPRRSIAKTGTPGAIEESLLRTDTA